MDQALAGSVTRSKGPAEIHDTMEVGVWESGKHPWHPWAMGHWPAWVWAMGLGIRRERSSRGLIAPERTSERRLFLGLKPD